MEWEAWFTHGRRYASPGWKPDELPEDGMVGVVEYLKPPYRRVIDGADWYVWDGETWRTFGPGGDTGEWGPKPRSGIVIRSAPSLPDDEWNALQREMFEARVRPSERIHA